MTSSILTTCQTFILPTYAHFPLSPELLYKDQAYNDGLVKGLQNLPAFHLSHTSQQMVGNIPPCTLLKCALVVPPVKAWHLGMESAPQRQYAGLAATNKV